TGSASPPTRRCRMADDVTRRLDRLSEIHPTDAAADRALDRARAALSARPAPERFRMFNRIAVAAVAAAVLIGLALWFVRPPVGVTVAAAELMQDRVAKTKSVTLTLKIGDRVEGTEQCLADGRARFEGPDDSYFIVDPGKQRCLTVSPKNKQA